jgi:hypothetical protein
MANETSRREGEELSQLARLLFDSSANKWYAALLLEVVVGLVAAIAVIFELQGDAELVGAFLGVALLLVAHGLRLWADQQYDVAETMRRQSVFTEGMGWPLDSIQASEWRKKAGKRIRKSLKSETRPVDYFATQSTIGPARLAEMTRESAFYTRHLYDHLRIWIWLLVGGAAIAAVTIISLALTRTISEDLDVQIARILYIIIPVLISINLVGWGFRLNRSVASIRQVETDLQRLLDSDDVEATQAVRLVSEYDCQVVSGIPIHNWLFSKWHDDIQELWQEIKLVHGVKGHEAQD